jgi:hypothetical protein|tara:strand:- start:128 stop:310 length:183 start_codon:yes stop_codon:yes gene_type:complete
MKKTFKKVESTVVCKSTASLKAEIAGEIDKEDGNLEELLEKSRNSHDCGKNSCKCSRQDK